MRRLLLSAATLPLLLFSGAHAAQATAGSGTFHWDAGAGAVCAVEATAACEGVTLRAMLCHTAGLPGDVPPHAAPTREGWTGRRWPESAAPSRRSWTETRGE